LERPWTRNAHDLRTRLGYWRVQARLARADVDRIDRDVRFALGVPQVGGSCVEWAAQLRAERDEFAAESERRETEIVDLLGERDTALARVAELEALLTGAAGSVVRNA
jgi:hypothetical protein